LGPWKSQSSRRLTSRLSDCADAAGTDAMITKPVAATVRMNDRLVEAPWSDTLDSPLFSSGRRAPRCGTANLRRDRPVIQFPCHAAHDRHATMTGAWARSERTFRHAGGASLQPRDVAGGHGVVRDSSRIGSSSR